MSSSRFGPNFPKVFTAALLQEVSFVLLVHFPGYLTGLGATESRIGVLYASAAVLALVLRPALGRILDVTHRRTVLLVAGVGNATVILALVSTSTWGPWLWALFLTQRVLQIALFTSMLTYGADSLPVERRTQGLALFGLSGLLPISLGGVAGDLIIASSGFTALFLTSAAAAAVSWLLVWQLPLLPVLGRRPRRSFWAALVQRDLLPVWWASLSFGIGMETVFTFTRTYVDERAVGSAGLFFGVYGLTAASVRVFGGGSYDRVPHRPLMMGALGMAAFGFLLLAMADSTVVLAFGAFATGLAHGVIFPILTSQVVGRSRTAERGSAVAIFTSIFDVSLLVAGPAVGFLIDGFGYGAGFGAVVAVLGVGALVYAVWDRRLVASDALA